MASLNLIFSLRSIRLFALGSLTLTTGFAASLASVTAALPAGTKYQIVFVTSDTFFATSSTISTYNTDVTNEANLSSILAPFDAKGLTWTAIGSTTGTSASVNAPSTGLVFTLNGLEVASAADELYSGSLLDPIDVDQYDATLDTSVWTGSNSTGGPAGGINDLGQTFTEYGTSTSTTAAWIATTNGIESDNGLSLYALSSVITVGASTPEPGTIGLCAGALLLLSSLVRLSAKKKCPASAALSK